MYGQNGLFCLLASLLLVAKIAFGDGAPSRQRNERERDPDWMKSGGLPPRKDLQPKEEMDSRNRPRTDLDLDSRGMTMELVKDIFGLESGVPSENLTGIYRTPDYMMEIYNRVADNRTGVLVNRTKTTKRRIDPTEIIQSLACREVKEHKGSWRLSFSDNELPAVTKKTTVAYAELVLHRNACGQRKLRQLDRRALRKRWTSKVEVFGARHQETDSGGVTRHLPFAIDTAQVQDPRDSDCWQTFDVTAAVRNWQEQRKNEQDRLRHFVLVQKKFWKDARSLDYHYQLRPVANGRRPVLIVFTGRTVPFKPSSKSDEAYPIPEANHEGTRQKRQAAAPVANPYHDFDKNKLRSRIRPDEPQHTDCARRDFFVDFTAIGWNHWVVAPQGYNAYRCAGSCSFPIKTSVRSTPRAHLESYIMFRNRLKESSEESPGKLRHLGVCCVPTAHRQMTMIYFTDQGNSVIKFFKKMIASRCGCR